jgi:putative transcriptional regulator
MTGVESLRGKLLLATPGLVDPNFFRSVVLLLEHNEGGALGVVLNRPTDTAVQEALPTWADLAAEPAVVFTGGPVQPDSAIGLGLASLGDEPDGFAPLLGGVGSVDLAREPDDIRPAPERLRVFAGYSGWGEGQLEGEIVQASWFVVDAEPGDAWTRDPSGLWRAVLRRQRGRVKLFADCPTDPTTN